MKECKQLPEVRLGDCASSKIIRKKFKNSYYNFEKRFFGGAMILANFKELLILLRILKNVDNEKKHVFVFGSNDLRKC